MGESLQAVLIGCGNRGRFVYGGFARAHPERLRFVALAEPVDERRAAVAAELGVPRAHAFRDWRELLASGPLAPVAVIATGDTLHVEPALAALARGHHVLLEKPIAPTAAECVRVVEAAEAAGRMLQIGHVLRYTPFYARIAELLATGVLGELVHLELKEHVATWHMTHSYVRGKFRSLAVAAPIVLAKACHDLDLLVWFAGRPAARVASFGSLSHYRAEQAPAGAPPRCTDGCPVQADCPHDAERFYLGPGEDLARIWPWSDVSADPSREARRRALATGPYGRCVYRCDNDVVDHQTLAVELEGGLSASFTVHGHASEERRTIRLSGTRGELRGVLQTGEIELTRHGVLGREVERVSGSALGHYGGDEGLLDHFVRVARDGGRPDALRTSGRISLESHLLGFAAETARREGRVVDMAAFRERVRGALGAEGASNAVARPAGA
jgi:predicted dehydrogenase